MDDAPTISRVRKADSADHTPASKLRGLPRRLVTQAAHRVGTAALTWAGAYVAAIGVNEYAAHAVGRLPPHGWNLGHTVAILFVAVSLGLFVVSRSRKLAPGTTPRSRSRVRSARRLCDRRRDERGHGVGWSRAYPRAVVDLRVDAGFPFIVPATPTRAAVAAFATALMAPAGLATWHVLSGTPMPDARVWSGITIPSLMCAGIAAIGSRIVYGLGRDIERARAMGAYRLEERLSQGGMGEIWRARHHMLARPAAIKLVRSTHSSNVEARRAAIARFEREAQMTARLSSPHTVRLYDFGVTDEGTFYYAMELLEGRDLESLVASKVPCRPSGLCTSSSRPAAPWRRPTRWVSCIAISSRRIFSCAARERNTTCSRCWTSGSFDPTHRGLPT